MAVKHLHANFIIKFNLRRVFTCNFHLFKKMKIYYLWTYALSRIPLLVYILKLCFKIIY